jgi:Fe-S-cluster containining protein
MPQANNPSLAASDGAPTADPELMGIISACPRVALKELVELYSQVDRAVSRLDLSCLGGGACCRFDLAGHRLYVTPMELSLLASHPPMTASQPLRCPYQLGPRCGARPVRPLGCRVFFCRGEPAGRDVYEHHHRRIRRLHVRHGVPYRYVELSGALRQLLG